jgi:hypothetical protein
MIGRILTLKHLGMQIERGKLDLETARLDNDARIRAAADDAATRTAVMSAYGRNLTAETSATVPATPTPAPMPIQGQNVGTLAGQAQPLPSRSLGTLGATPASMPTTPAAAATPPRRPIGPKDLEDAADDLMRSGHVAPGMSLLKTVYDERKRILDRTEATLKVAQARMTTAGQIVQSMTDEESFQANLPTLRAVIGPELTAYVGDHYDPARLKMVMDQGMTMRDHVTQQRDATTALLGWARLALDKGRNDRETLAAGLKGGGSLLAIADSEQTWQGAIGNLKTAGVPDTVVSLFPAHYSPANARLAGQMAMTADERVTAALRAAGEAETRRHNVVMENKPTAATPTLTRAQSGIIERNFQNRLDQLEKRYQAVGADRTIPKVKAQMDAEKLKIYNSYLTQRGEDTVEELPADWSVGKGTPGAGQAKRPAPTTTPAAPSAGPKVKMTRERAASIIKTQAGRDATPAEIDRFLTKYPYEQ